MLNIENVTKYYRKLAAVNQVSFTVPPGTIAVLVGPNGAGKSTLLKSIMGLLRHEGRISFNGIPTEESAGRERLGYVPELPAAYPLLTVREHIEFAARLYKVENWEALADELLERFDLTDKQNKLGSELSKGMQQKVGICSAMIHRPDLVFFDEPMMGLDPYAIKELKAIFSEIKERGGSCLISTHILDSVEDVWDQAMIMQNGGLKAVVHRDDPAMAGKNLEDYFFEVTDLSAHEMKAQAVAETEAPVDKPKKGLASLFGKKPGGGLGR